MAIAAGVRRNKVRLTLATRGSAIVATFACAHHLCVVNRRIGNDPVCTGGMTSAALVGGCNVAVSFPARTCLVMTIDACLRADLRGRVRELGRRPRLRAMAVTAQR